MGTYTAWSVVFGEQPSAAKWNQLGQNDAGFRDGSNIQPTNNQWIQWNNASASLVNVIKLHSDNYLRLAQLPKQSNTTNSTEDNILIQFGWGVTTAGAAAVRDEAVTFPVAYSSAPVVFITSSGDDTAGSTTWGQGAFEEKTFHCEAGSIATTGFQARMRSADGTSWTNSTSVFYSWMAIGPKS